MESGPSHSNDDDFEELLCSALERFAAHGARGVDELLAESPAHAARVRKELARLARLGLLGDSPSGSASNVPEVLGGFRLVRRLGEGGMGLIWEAEELALGRRVALKMIRPDQLHFAGARERFRREVEAVARLQHSGIVPVYAVGEEHGIPFFTMELFDGCTLADVLRELAGRDPSTLHGVDLARALDRAMRGRPEHVPAEGALFESSWIDACTHVARQVAEALEHAHGRGLVHRDVKPSNIALTRTGRAMLFDFGLARADAVDPLTKHGSQPGSLPYMSPEQVRGAGELDGRADVYSLGATFYELLALAPAFPTTTWDDTRARILAGALEPLRPRNAAIPWDVETVCLTALARERDRRYASAQDFARDLSNVLARRPIEARRPGVALRFVRWSQRHPKASAACFVAVPLVLAGALAFAASESVRRARETELRFAADASARTAREARDELLRLADLKRLADLERDAATLWPALPERVASYEAWLARARELAARRAEHEATLAALRSRPGAQRTENGGWSFATTEDQWQHDALVDLLLGLDRLATPERGLVAGLEARLAFARTIDERSRSGADARARWDDAVRSIADRSACPRYAGLRVSPQLGLLPLGRDPASSLWEFAHLESGALPARDADGRFVIDEAACIVLVLLPGGAFRMGSVDDALQPGFDPQAGPEEFPATEVTLAPFFASKYELTRTQWARLSETPLASSEDCPPCPAGGMSFDDAVLVLGRRGLRVPTEAQWEYACRGGTTTRYFTGDAKETLAGHANLFDVTVAPQARPAGRPYEAWLDDGFVNAAPVGSFRPNPFGLHDVAGNLYEWTSDPWVDYAEVPRGEDGQRSGGDDRMRVFRGGACTSLADAARSAWRQRAPRGNRGAITGVRPVRPLEP
ncbi:MAG: bifunctional serine/threonine-protein kinase/formylglycine-generating enzyme family protein [Planctomycetota bacterium]